MNFLNKLQILNQGYESVDEYYKDMEFANIRVNMKEDSKATMTRFLHGLKCE